MPPEAPIPRMTGDGWAGLEPEDQQATQEHNAELGVEQKELDDAIRATFARSKAGKKVWSWLWKNVMLNPGFSATLGMDRGASLGFYMEGQRALVMDLKKRMDRANG